MKNRITRRKIILTRLGVISFIIKDLPKRFGELKMLKRTGFWYSNQGWFAVVPVPYGSISSN